MALIVCRDIDCVCHKYSDWCLSHHRPACCLVVVLTPMPSHPGGAEFGLGNILLSKPSKSLLRGKGEWLFFPRAAECGALVTMVF